MKTRSIIGSVLAAVVLFQSCTKDETSLPQVTLVEKIVKDVPADTIVGLSPIGQPVGSGKFTFYSFESNAVVPNSDSASTKWDIGVRGTTIITNGGTSGPGNGGAFIYVGTFDDLATVPADSTFKVDAAPNFAITSGSNRGWYLYTPQTNLVTPLPGRVLVIRTATGKYAKIEILNYYKGGTTPAATDPDDVKIFTQRYYTFKFAYQADGTTNFRQ
jgi:hypothetical protein